MSRGWKSLNVFKRLLVEMRTLQAIFVRAQKKERRTVEKASVILKNTYIVMEIMLPEI